MEHCHARSGAPAQFRLRRRFRRLHPRRRTRPPHPIDRQPADQAAGRRCRPAAAQPQRQGCDADRSRRAAAVLCAAAAGACGRSARRGGAPRERGRGAARRARGFCRLSPGQIAGGVFALASRPAARRPRRPERQPQARIERGELDLALFKRAAGEKGGIAVWPERVHWVTSKSHPRDITHRLGAADRLSLRLPLSRARDPCAGKRRALLAHGLYEFQTSPASRPRSPPAWA